MRRRNLKLLKLHTVHARVHGERINSPPLRGRVILLCLGLGWLISVGHGVAKGWGARCEDTHVLPRMRNAYRMRKPVIHGFDGPVARFGAAGVLSSAAVHNMCG